MFQCPNSTQASDTFTINVAPSISHLPLSPFRHRIQLSRHILWPRLIFHTSAISKSPPFPYPHRSKCNESFVTSSAHTHIKHRGVWVCCKDPLLGCKCNYLANVRQHINYGQRRSQIASDAFQVSIDNIALRRPSPRTSVTRSLWIPYNMIHLTHRTQTLDTQHKTRCNYMRSIPLMRTCSEHGALHANILVAIVLCVSRGHYALPMNVFTLVWDAHLRWVTWHGTGANT